MTTELPAQEFGGLGREIVKLAQIVGTIAATAFLLSPVQAETNQQPGPNNAYPLAEAALRGDTEQIKSLLAEGAQVDQLSSVKTTIEQLTPLMLTPLGWAAASGQVPAAKLLLQAGANVNDSRGTNKNTPVHMAVLGGHTDMVKLLAAAGADLDAHTESGMTPLVQSVIQGRGLYGTADTLIQLGADPNVEATTIEAYPASYIDPRGTVIGQTQELTAELEVRGTALTFALRRNNRALAELLIEAGANPNYSDSIGFSPLHYAASLGDEKLVSLLLEQGANPNLKSQLQSDITPLYLAVKNGHLGTLKLLIKAGADVNTLVEVESKTGEIGFKTPLLIAIEDANIEIAKLLLDNGANPNRLWPPDTEFDPAIVMTPLDAAIYGAQNHPTQAGKLVQLLITRGADVQARTWFRVAGLPKPYDDLALLAPPLFAAVMKGNPELIQILVENGADPNSTACSAAPKRSCLSALDLAAIVGDPARISSLLQFGANPNNTDTSGMTALHWAAYAGASESAQLLLAHGANPKLKDKEGKTPLDYARESGNSELVTLLENAKAMK